MALHDELGMRMKGNYEEVSKTRLTKRTPVIVRLDGRAFHTFTRKFVKPFDDVLIATMQDTMLELCKNIQGCELGYTQSDEISLLLIDYKELESQAFFDYEVQKICSITASMATLFFNDAFWSNVERAKRAGEITEDQCEIYNKVKMTAMFDSRCFNIPREEVTNYFYWRQLDATRNSIQMVGQANFSHRELHKKSSSDIQEMLHERMNINWNDYPTVKKRGTCGIKKDFYIKGLTCISAESAKIEECEGWQKRGKWCIDTEIPIFKGEGRNYIERFVDYENK